MKNKKIIITVVALLAAAAVIAGIWFAVADNEDELTGTLSITRTDFAPADSIINAYTANPALMTDKIAASYDMDMATASRFTQSPEEWLAYELVLSVVNNTNKPVTLHSLDVQGNGKNGVYICTELESGIGVTPGASAAISLSVLCGNGELSDAEVEEFSKSIDIAAIYTVGSLDTDIQTLSDVETMTVYLDA